MLCSLTPKPNVLDCAHPGTQLFLLGPWDGLRTHPDLPFVQCCLLIHMYILGHWTAQFWGFKIRLQLDVCILLTALQHKNLWTPPFVASQCQGSLCLLAPLDLGVEYQEYFYQAHKEMSNSTSQLNFSWLSLGDQERDWLLWSMYWFWSWPNDRFIPL